MIRSRGFLQPSNGIALITVLLITSVITIIVAAMATQQSVDIRRTANILDRNQAYVLAMGGELYAKWLLKANPFGNIDYIPYAELPPQEVEGGTVSGSVTAQSGCFNLTNLVKNRVSSQPDVERFKRLLSALKLERNLADAAADWMDADNTVSFPGGAESDYYARLNPPYAIANQPLVSVSELAAVKGYTPEVMATLTKGNDICALPNRTKININTASKEVLMTLAPGMTQTIANAIISGREQANVSKPSKPGETGHFTNLKELYAAVPQLSSIIPQKQIDDAYDTKTEFFLVQAEGTFGEGDVVLYSLLQRGAKNITSYYRAQGSY